MFLCPFPRAVASRCATISYRLSYLRFLVSGRLIPDSLARRFTGERAQVEDADIGIKRARSDGSYHPLLAEPEHLDHAISQRR